MYMYMYMPIKTKTNAICEKLTHSVSDVFINIGRQVNTNYRINSAVYVFDQLSIRTGASRYTASPHTYT